jgi:hypothetical protein
MKKTGLSLRALTQGVRAELYHITIVVQPEDIVTVVFELEIVKAGGIDLEKVEHLAFCKYRPQVHDTGKAILPDDLDDAEYDWFGTLHGDNLGHGTLAPLPPEGITARLTHQGWRW